MCAITRHGKIGLSPLPARECIHNLSLRADYTDYVNHLHPEKYDCEVHHILLWVIVNLRNIPVLTIEKTCNEKKKKNAWTELLLKSRI